MYDQFATECNRAEFRGSEQILFEQKFECNFERNLRACVAKDNARAAMSHTPATPEQAGAAI